MVLLECALFVRNLRDKNSKTPSHWVRINKDAPSTAAHLKKWGDSIGEKLRVVELRERDTIQQMRSRCGKDPSVLSEEPVLPDVVPEGAEGDEVEGPKFQTVSFGIKMAACVLLDEITRYLRDCPSPLPSSFHGDTPRVSITNLDGNRRLSLTSTTSTETDTLVTPTYSSGANLHPSSDRRPPTIGALPHSISLDEDRERQFNGNSFEEEEFLSLNAAHPPLQKKVSVYLRVNSAIEGGEALRKRRNSGLKQTVNVRFSPTLGGPTSKRRSSISVTPTSVNQRHVSFRKAEHPSPKSRPLALTTGAIRPKARKESAPVPTQSKLRMENVPSSQSFQDHYLEAVTPELTHRPSLQHQPSTSSQRSTNIGTQIQHGISRLRTRAKFFRKIVRRKTAIELPKTVPTGNAPFLAQRKRPRRLSQGHGLGIEDKKWFFPWLDVVEHIIIIDALNPEAHSRHVRACKELVTALTHMYEVFEATDVEPVPGQQGSMTSVSRSLSSIFAAPWLNYGGEEGTEGIIPYPPPSITSPSALPLRRKKAQSPLGSVALVGATETYSSVTLETSKQLASLDFSKLQRSVANFLMRDATIEGFLEQDTSLSKQKSDSNFNHARRRYLDSSWSGLLHSPFSLMVYSSPILHSESFSALREIAWGLLLDTDANLAQAAGECSNFLKGFFFLYVFYLCR